jgi:hypothetical protein
MKPQASAAARTLGIPGVDVREQRDREPVPIKATGQVRKAVLDTRRALGRPKSLHLALYGSSDALCGTPVVETDGADGLRHMCAVCHVEASKRLLEIA